jgi:hypothetical protein
VADAVKFSAMALKALIESDQAGDAIQDGAQRLVHELGGHRSLQTMTPAAGAIYLIALALAAD